MTALWLATPMQPKSLLSFRTIIYSNRGGWGRSKNCG
jgi:hypothetical protein